MQSAGQTSLFHVHAVAIIQLFFSIAAAAALIEALIISHLDYWKKVLRTNLPCPFHRTQCATARVTISGPE